jgi:hypothetical protein
VGKGEGRKERLEGKVEGKPGGEGGKQSGKENERICQVRKVKPFISVEYTCQLKTVSTCFLSTRYEL